MIKDLEGGAQVEEKAAAGTLGGCLNFAYKALHNTELHIKHYIIRNTCLVSVFVSAL